MRSLPSKPIDFDADEAWTERNRHWSFRSSVNRPKRSKRTRETTPLILAGFGVSFRVEGGSLFVRNGLTHYPQKAETYRFFKGDFELPDRIVLLDCTGSISMAVMTWLAEQGVSLINLDWQGRVTCISTPTGYASNQYRVEWQRQTRADPEKRMNFCNCLIIEKIEASLKTLEKYVPRSDAWNIARLVAFENIEKINSDFTRTVRGLQGLEGTAAAAYFRAWSEIPIQWRSDSRRPIPAAWKKIGIRGSRFHFTGSQNAKVPINAILNYAYTVLQSRTQIWAVAHGYDPTSGIMHEKRIDAPSFIFDIMEPRRAHVDRAIIQFINSEKLDPADFYLTERGICRLNPELARFIAGVVEAEISLEQGFDRIKALRL